MAKKTDNSDKAKKGRVVSTKLATESGFSMSGKSTLDLLVGLQVASAPSETEASTQRKPSFSRKPLEVSDAVAAKLEAIRDDLLLNGSRGTGPLTPEKFDRYFAGTMGEPVEEDRAKSSFR